MTLEDRVSSLLQEAASTVPTTAASMGPEDRVLQRRRRRRTGASTVAIAVIVVATIGVARVARQSTGISVAADRASTTTIGPRAANDAGLSPPDSSDKTPSVTDLSPTDNRATSSSYRAEVPADTGPELKWTEVEPPDAWDGGQMVWTAGQFVGAVRQASSFELIASADGSQWATVGSLPTGSSGPAFLASGNHLLAWTEGEMSSSEVFVSEDAGRSWDALGSVHPPDATSTKNGRASGYVTRTRHLTTAAVAPGASGQPTVVLATMTTNDLDVQRLLADNGVDVADEAAVAYSIDPDPATVSVCIDLRCSAERTFTLPELGLTDEEVAAITSGTESTDLWRSIAGGPLEQVPVEVRGHIASVTWANDHFLLVVTAGPEFPEETTLSGSTDGLTWDPLPLPPIDGVGAALVSTDRAVYFSRWDDQGFLAARSSTDGGRTWDDGFGLPITGSALQGGPSGLVAVGGLESPPLEVSKDGFTVSLANQGVLLIDEATNETLLSLDVDALTAEDAPETVIYQEDPYQLTFLHPGTLEPLVTVTEADLLAADPRQGSPSDIVLGWSADGSGWGWQSATEAFGFEAWPSIVVGEGVLLSVVYEIPGRYDNPGSATPTPRMFVAKTR